MSYRSKKFDFLLAWAEEEAQRYKTEYDRIAAEREAKIADMKNNYISNSKRYNDESSRIEEEFTKAVGELRAETSEYISKAIEDVRNEERSRIQNINEGRLAKLRAIKDIPMTQEELLAVIENNNDVNDYWSSRMILEIAGDNAIDYFNGFVEASFSVKMNVLDQLAEQAERVIAKYPGEVEEDRAMIRYGYLTAPVLNRAREIFYGENNVVEDSTALLRAKARLALKCTDLEKATVIGNLLRNARGNMRNELLCEIVESKDITALSINLSGYGEEIKNFKSEDYRAYREASAAIEKYKSAVDSGDKQKEEIIVNENAENAFFNDFLEKENKSKKELEELSGVVVEPEA